ncbi:MAG: acetyl-CoA carboxylase biotin carboxylase subunit family protein [Burkholderiaceae bacterium]
MAISPTASLSKIGTEARREAPPEILWLFGLDWAALAEKRFSGTFKVHSAGFDLFSFPSNAGVLWFDMERFVRRLARKHGSRLSAVLSHEEQFGALAAALVAEELGLPGTPVNAILKLQHKLICRNIIERVAPECNIGYGTLDCELGQLPTDVKLNYPVFCKPVKASFSVLARRLDSHEDLLNHVRFKPFEKHIIERLVKPFDDICQRRLDAPVDARSLLMEENYLAEQFNLDGYVYQGQPRLLGVVDEVMYPDTQAFLRFAYPSKLKPSVRQRAFDVASAVLKEAGFDHGFFNMEFFYNESTDELKIVEFNPRLAAQLADLYERVDGLDVHAMSLALAMGQDPALVPRRKPKGTFAASCALRTFDGSMPGQVSRAKKREVSKRFSDAIVLYFHKSRSGTEREFKWMSSNRYGVINLHGEGEDGLRRHYEDICQTLGWPTPF